jgi:hypothetical protein
MCGIIASLPSNQWAEALMCNCARRKCYWSSAPNEDPESTDWVAYELVPCVLSSVLQGERAGSARAMRPLLGHYACSRMPEVRSDGVRLVLNDELDIALWMLFIGYIPHGPMAVFFVGQRSSGRRTLRSSNPSSPYVTGPAASRLLPIR